MMTDLKESKSKDLLMQHRGYKEEWKKAEDSQIKAYYFGKMRQMEGLIRQDWYVKLNHEGTNITPEMGKPSFKS
jgi:hypothetical protein